MTFIICEAAATHDGSLEKALQLVEWSAEIGASACKFQWLSSPERLAERRNAHDYLNAYRLLAFPRAWFRVLERRCAELRIEFMCTTYLPEDIHVVAPFVKRFKVSGFEAEDRHFVGLHGTWPDKALCISAARGAFLSVSIEHWRRVVNVNNGGGPTCTVFHCVSAYPCPSDELNLRRLHPRWSRADHLQPRGFSDHSRHPWAGALAVAAGAVAVEFHMRLNDTSEKNADFAVARSPEEARAYVANIREADAMLGRGDNNAMPSEAPWAKYAVRGT